MNWIWLKWKCLCNRGKLSEAVHIKNCSGVRKWGCHWQHVPHEAQSVLVTATLSHRVQPSQILSCSPSDRLFLPHPSGLDLLCHLLPPVIHQPESAYVWPEKPSSGVILITYITPVVTNLQWLPKLNLILHPGPMSSPFIHSTPLCRNVTVSSVI